jgi:hypothetical protein
MFVPVKVEIDVGAICIGVLPVRLEMSLGVAYADMFRAECIEIRDVNGERECRMDFLNKKIWVSDYRITDFTFGGVMVGNPKFDPIRIDNEDEVWLKANLPKPATAKKTAAPTAKKTAAPTAKKTAAAPIAKSSGGQGSAKKPLPTHPTP